MNRMRRPHRYADPSKYSRVAAFTAATFAAVLFALVSPGFTVELRTWKSATGSYSTEAEFVELTADGAVRLKRKDGSTVNVPLAKLSSADQEFARSQAGAQGSRPTNANAKSPKSPEEVEQDAADCRTAKEAVLVYKFYLALPNLTSQQRATATANLKAWEQKAAEDQVKLGKEWMTKDEADKIRKQADAKIAQAKEYLRLANGDLAKKTLEEASRLDPDSIQADFLMGVVYGAIANNDKKAQLHFEKCLRREPDNVSVLNNLAITLVFQKQYPQAAKHWKTAANNAPKMQALSQNIGSLITMAGTGKYKVPPKTLQDLSEVYDDLITKHGNPRPAEVGFVFTPPYGSGWGNSKGESSGGKKESVVVSSGSGFVIAPHVILTNRHVVKGASGLLVLDPKDPKGEPLPAELIAESSKPDLALIRCNSLNAPAVELSAKLPPRGTDIMVLGYPLGPSFGTTLKSTRGAMVAMPPTARQHVPV